MKDVKNTVTNHVAIALAACAAQAHAGEASGRFDIVMTPAVQQAAAPDDTRGRMTFTKTFQGPLSGTSTGEMLTAGAPAKGSAGYVAMERFEGRLDGRPGSFVMQHSGTMDGGAQTLAIVIAPGSGTGELTGIAGTASIDIRDKLHYYTLRYQLPPR